MNTVLHSLTTSQKNRHITQPFVVVGCVIKKDGKYLLINENSKWNLPSGWLELDESLEVGAKREAEEETGQEVEIEGLLGIYSLIKHKPNMLLHSVKFLFIAHLTGKTTQSKENLKMSWFTLDDLLSMEGQFWDIDLPIIISDASKGIIHPLAIQQHKTIDKN